MSPLKIFGAILKPPKKSVQRGTKKSTENLFKKSGLSETIGEGKLEGIY